MERAVSGAARQREDGEGASGFSSGPEIEEGGLMLVSCSGRNRGVVGDGREAQGSLGDNWIEYSWCCEGWAADVA